MEQPGHEIAAFFLQIAQDADLIIIPLARHGPTVTLVNASVICNSDASLFSVLNIAHEKFTKLTNWHSFC